MDAKEIIELIKTSKKQTPYKVFIRSKEEIDFKNLKWFGTKDLYIIYAEKRIEPLLVVTVNFQSARIYLIHCPGYQIQTHAERILKDSLLLIRGSVHIIAYQFV